MVAGWRWADGKRILPKAARATGPWARCLPHTGSSASRALLWGRECRLRDCLTVYVLVRGRPCVLSCTDWWPCVGHTWVAWVNEGHSCWGGETALQKEDVYKLDSIFMWILLKYLSLHSGMYCDLIHFPSYICILQVIPSLFLSVKPLFNKIPQFITC